MTHATASRETGDRAGGPAPPAGEPILEAKALRLGYGTHAVLEDVNLALRAGECWFLVGPNGHGKTTLLRGLLGRLEPLGGRIKLRGDLARPERIGFVPQQCAMNATLPTTVREFVLFGLVGIPARKAERADRLTWALDKVGLTGRETSDYWSLSGGQRQRALVARALIRRPGVFIADEPTSGMDLSVEASLFDSLADLNRTEHLSLIVVTHDLTAAARFGTHVALVHDGQVEAGPVHEVLRPATLERAYRVKVEVCHEPSGFVNIRIGSMGGTI